MSEPGAPATGSHRYLLRHYARNVNDDVENAQTPLPLREGGTVVHIKPGATAGFYSNYSGSFLNRYPGLTLDQNSRIAWRWVSKDGRAVAVNLNYGQPGAAWGFIPRNDLLALLPYSDGRLR